MLSLKKHLFVGLSILLFLSCSQEQKTVPQVEKDPLPSWNTGETKTAILNFVKAVTDETSPDFVAISDRIATFDNDGNLWSEQPMYFQLQFAIDRVKELAAVHPEWETEQPFKAVLENDIPTLLASGNEGLAKLVMKTHAGMSIEEFDAIVKNWLINSKHPRFDKEYNKLIYQPMLELLDYLRANDFKTFIVSGGGIEFMRSWTEEAYGIPKDQVVGSSIKCEFVIDDKGARIIRLPELDFIDDKEGKPIGIAKFIGKRPIFASGNSDGDLQMLQYTASGQGKRFMLYLHHTDAEREWAYDKDSHIGRLDKGLDEAAKNGWSVIDMKRDWKLIYPFQLNEK